MVNARQTQQNGHDEPLCFYVPSPLHPAAYERAQELGVDVIHPADSRSATWWEYANAIVLRQGYLKGDLRKASKLKILARNGTGYDMVDVPLCKELGIAVTNLPGFNAEAVAEMTLSLALSVARRTVEFDRRLRAGETIPSAYNLGLSLFNKTIGLVGMGDIAREVALKFSLAFSCKIIIYSPTSPAARWTTSSTVPSEPVIPHTRVATLDELLEQSDVVSLHCPELPETRNMMGQAQFAKMKQSAIFLNLGRGGLVDEDALYEACKNRRIFGAGLDCFVNEPVTAATYGKTLFSLDNVVVQPHAGASTIEVTKHSTIFAVETAYEYCKGQGFGKSSLVRELEESDLTRRPRS